MCEGGGGITLAYTHRILTFGTASALAFAAAAAIAAASPSAIACVAAIFLARTL